MSLRSQESRAQTKALLSGLVVPALLMASFVISARTTLAPEPASAKADEAPAAPTLATPTPTAPIPAAQLARSRPKPVAICLAGSSYGYSDDHEREFFWALVEG